MTNRQRLLRTSEYDTLVRMNSFLLKHSGHHDLICIIDVLEGRRRSVCPVFDSIVGYNTKCEKCIARWLNEEELYEVERKDDICTEADDATGDTKADC